MGCGKSKLAVATENTIAKTKSKESSEVSTQKENVETIPDKVINDTNVAVEKEKDEGEKESKNVDSKDNVQESEGTKEETLGGVIEETKNENNDNVDSKGGDDEKDANEVEEEKGSVEEAKIDSNAAEEEKGSIEEPKTETEDDFAEPMKDDVEGEKEPELAAVEPEAPTTTNEEEKTPEAPEGPTTTTTDAEEEKTSEAN
ncbi:hypothetical protein Acr_03g0020060 [Actinidia rufa]|uniref:Uncharacterized protein n=1 Tax=Actinidia rufa TaxID=165716 RepID=A0A7J0EFU5_9ERIC|nr:hypothetical protein Acr_03g0020060 [Actinidia rufa]